MAQTQYQCLEIGEIFIELIRKRVKNLSIGIHPPDGRVRVSAPIYFSDQMIKEAVSEKLPWIIKQKKKFKNCLFEEQLEIKSGEFHYFNGEKLLLQIYELQKARPKIIKNRAVLEFYLPLGLSKLEKERYLNRWYREQLAAMLPQMIEHWSKILGVSVNEWAIKQMKTRWGSCNPQAKRIWINLELMKHSRESLEYVLVHELAHLLEASHNERFKKIMTAALPNWRLRRQELKKIPLGLAS